MKCNVPILTSNVTSLPEVAGDAAIYADPESIESIASGMEKLAENELLREQLVERGKKQCEKFNWNSSAQKLWEVINSVVQN